MKIYELPHYRYQAEDEIGSVIRTGMTYDEMIMFAISYKNVALKSQQVEEPRPTIKHIGLEAWLDDSLDTRKYPDSIRLSLQ